MIGSEILLYPDTGPEFLRALKLGVLYSKRVHVLTLLDDTLLESYLADEQPKQIPPSQPKLRANDFGPHVPILGVGVPVPSTANALEYLRFVQENRADLSLLIGEGVLTSDFPQAFSFGGTFRADPKVLRALDRWPPSYWDFLQSLPLEAHQRAASFQGHLCFIASIAQQTGLGLATWSWDFQEVLWNAVSQLAEGGPISSEPLPLSSESASQRRLVETGLAQVVLERYVPRVDDLPITEILELKRKYAAELERFHEAVRQLATHVDLAQAPAQVKGQIQDLVAREVDPAVSDLYVTLGGARLDFFKKLLGKEPIAAGIGVVIAAVRGSPFDIAAALGTAGAAATAAFETAIDRRKALTASHWSILFRLKKLQRRKSS
jgi:hypothetical protein